MQRKLYLREEIDEIKKVIEPYKIFCLTSNKKPSYYLTISLIGYLTSIYASKRSKYFVPLFSCFTVRLFLIFHDCCHNSFFKVTEKQHNSGIRGYNKIVAQILAPLVEFDELSWRTGHGHHHKIHGNKSELDITKTVITLKEYEHLPIYKKIIYRIFRTPIIFFTISPIYIFFLNHIFKPTHILKCIIFYSLIFKFGHFKLVKRVFVGQWFGGVIGTTLFHLQHQVNTGYWESFDKKDKLSYDRAQLHGASMLLVPKFLKWITFGIEYHHIHHLTPRIPSYNLQKCHENNEHLFNKVTKVGYIQAFKSIFHTLYDENEKRYRSFMIDRFLGLEY